MKTYTITLTDEEDIALASIAVDPAEWIRNFVLARCEVAKEAIVASEIKRLTEDPDVTSIPADKDEIVRNAPILSAAEVQQIRNAEAEIPIWANL